jgi:hypothetical protein
VYEKIRFATFVVHRHSNPSSLSPLSLQLHHQAQTLNSETIRPQQPPPMPNLPEFKWRFQRERQEFIESVLYVCNALTYITYTYTYTSRQRQRETELTPANKGTGNLTAVNFRDASCQRGVANGFCGECGVNSLVSL